MLDHKKRKIVVHRSSSGVQELKYYWCPTEPPNDLVVDPTHRPLPILEDLEVLVLNCRSEQFLSMPDRRDRKNRASTSIIESDVNGPTSRWLKLLI
jgi:hypothetical protein